MKKEGIKTEWNFSALFNGDDDPKVDEERKKIEKVCYEFVKKWKEREDYLKKPEVLKEALDEYEVISDKYASGGKEGLYLSMRFAQDQNNSKIKAKFNKFEDFYKKIDNEMQFFGLKLAKVDDKTQKLFLSSKELVDYKHFLERVFRQAKYLLGEEEEKILNLKSTPSYSNWVEMVSGFISKEERDVLKENGKKEKATFSEISSLISSPNKEVRDSAAVALNEIVEKNADVAEAELNSIMFDKKINDGLRGFERPDLARHLGDDVESEVVDVLVESVSKRFDLSKKYYELKAKLMNVKKMKYHERNIPYEKVGKKYSYEKAVDLVYNVFNGLDKEFAKIFMNFIENGQVDVYPRKGKRDGAFCNWRSPSMPIYVLLNYDDKLQDILTIAHEFGHAINGELSKKNNSLVYDVPISTTEVASTFMEDFVLQELEKGSDDELRLGLIMMKLNDDISTIFRQVACYKLEQDLHKEFREKGYVSKEEIGKIFLKNMSSYMGDSVELSPGSENWWVYWSHIRAYFYVYSYASGLLISKALQNMVKKDKKSIEKVKEFLSAGNSKSPKEIFLKLGIDITKKEFWNSGLNEIELLLKEAEELAKKLKKIK